MQPTSMKPSLIKNTFENHIAHIMNTPSCERCGGLLIKEYCLDASNPDGQVWITTKHCVQCGNVVDPVILKNQEEALSPHQVERSARPRPSYGVALQRRKL